MNSKMDNYIERYCTVAVVWQGVMVGRNKSRKTKDNWQSSGVAEERGRELNLYKNKMETMWNIMATYQSCTTPAPEGGSDHSKENDQQRSGACDTTMPMCEKNSADFQHLCQQLLGEFISIHNMHKLSNINIITLLHDNSVSAGFVFLMFRIFL